MAGALTHDEAGAHHLNVFLAEGATGIQIKHIENH